MYLLLIPVSQLLTPPLDSRYNFTITAAWQCEQFSCNTPPPKKGDGKDKLFPEYMENMENSVSKAIRKMGSRLIEALYKRGNPKAS